MNNIFIIIFLVLIVVFIFVIFNELFLINNKKNKSNKSSDFDNLTTKNVLTQTELYFFNQLKDYLDEKNLNIFTKIRLADFIKNKTRVSYSEYMKTFNKFNRKHIDFVITDINGKIKVLIELDDYTHNYKKNKQNDEMKNELFESLNVPLLRFKVGKYYNLNKLDQYVG